MPKERIVDGLTFVYSGVVDFKQLYSEIKNFWDGKGFDSIEKKHEEKVKEDGSRGIKLSWYCEREVTSYAKYIYEWELSIEKMKLIKINDFLREYVENMKIVINGDLEFDFGKYFGDKPFNIFLRGLFEEYVYKGEIKEHKKNVSKIANQFLDLIKTMTSSYKL